MSFGPIICKISLALTGRNLLLKGPLTSLPRSYRATVRSGYESTWPFSYLRLYYIFAIRGPALRWGFTWKKRTFCIACSNHSFNPNHNKLYITGKLILQRFWKRMFLCTASKSNLVPGCQRHYPQCKSLGYLRKDFSLQTSQTNKLLMLFQRIVPNCWYEWRILQNCKITCQKSHLKLNHQNVGDFSLIIFSPASPWQIPSFISIHLMSTNSPENFRSIA